MSELIQLKRTTVQDNRPTASGLSAGEPAITLHEDSFGLFFKDASNNIRKIGPIHVGTTAPNVSPSGSAGNSAGEAWLNTTNNSLSVWDGSQWVAISSSLETSGVSADTYGSSTEVAQIAVDEYGRITSASNVTIQTGVSLGLSLALG